MHGLINVYEPQRPVSNADGLFLRERMFTEN